MKMKKHLLKSLIAIVAVAAAIFATSSPALAVAPRTLPAGDTLYYFGCTINGYNNPGVGQLHDDGSIDTLVAMPSAPNPNGHCFFGPAYDPTSGLIYVLDVRQTPVTLWVYDPDTNSFAVSATADVSTCKPTNLAIDNDGNAYALTSYNAPNPNSLVTINLSTGECSAPIGSPFTTSIDAGFGGFGGFTFNPLDNVLYATDYTTGRFISINTSDGTVTDFPNSNFGSENSYGSVAFDSTGMTWIAYGDYAYILQSSPWASYNADYADQGMFNDSDIRGDAIVMITGGAQPTPEPLPDTGSNGDAGIATGAVALLLALAGTAGVVVARRKRGTATNS